MEVKINYDDKNGRVYLGNISKLGEKAIGRILKRSGAKVVNTAQKLIQNRTDGNWYYDKRAKRARRAGKYGEAPNTQTGTLVESIITELSSDRRSMYVGTNVDYADDLENGDHPFLKPALKANQNEIKKILEEEVKKALENA